MLSTVAVNLATQPPFAGEEAHRQYALGRQALAAENVAETFHALDAAKELDRLRFWADNRISKTFLRFESYLIDGDLASASALAVQLTTNGGDARNTHQRLALLYCRNGYLGQAARHRHQALATASGNP